MPIYLIRHGQSQFNAAFKRGDPDPMIFDARLTAKGIEQAKSIRKEVAELNIQQVIVSPLTRALQTAMFIFGGSHPLTITADHREQLSHSCDKGRPASQLQTEFPHLRFGHLDDIWWHQDPKNPNDITIEPDTVFQNRLTHFTANLYQYENRPIAIVGHGNAFREMSGVQMENCQILKLET